MKNLIEVACLIFDIPPPLPTQVPVQETRSLIRRVRKVRRAKVSGGSRSRG